MAGINIPELSSGNKWSGTTITYSFVSAFGTDYQDGDKTNIGDPVPLSASQRKIVLQILNYIQQIIPITFTEVDPTSGQVGDITFGIGSAIGTGKTVGVSGFTLGPIGQPGSSGDVWLAQNYNSEAFSFTVLHEIGHALGLKHPMEWDKSPIPILQQPPYLDPTQGYWSYSAMMSREYTDRYSTLPAPSTFMLYDVAELQSLYGAGVGNSGDNIYTFNGTPTRTTIWDAGGTDTISAAGSSASALINLNETKFSSIVNDSNYDPGLPANNIAIAYGVTIENAIGSSQADVIIGNKVANTIKGGAGDDLIFGDEVVAKKIIPDGLYRGWQFDAGLDWFKGKYQVDGTTGDQDGDILSGEAGADWIYGGAGDDRLSGGADNDYLDGGQGIDTALYDDASGAQTLVLAGGKVPDGAIPDGDGSTFSISRGAETDVLHSIEKLKLSSQADTFRVQDSGLNALKSIQEIDFGDQPDGTMDVLDLTPLGKSITFENNKINGYNTIFKNFENLKIDPGNDKVILKGPDVGAIKQVDFGGGNDTLDSDVRGLTVNFGNGNDTVEHVGYGTIVNFGTGTNTYKLSADNILVTGLDANDIIANGGDALHGAIGSSNSESGWVTSAFNNIKYGINVVGDLVIRDSMGHSTYVSNYKGGPDVPFSQQTAGIFIGIGKVWVEKLMEISRPFNETIGTTFKAGNALFYTMTGTKAFPADPLVLDLNGDGLNLTAVSSAAPMFDVFGTGFSVRTGWVQPSDGILAIDKNGNGNIDDVSELIGGESGNGFATLAQYDSNGDGVIDANDAVYSQLRVWQDANGNAVVDPGELKTLLDLGIASINVASTAQNGMSAAGNSIEATGTFTWANGSTGAVGDVVLTTDPFHSQYKGDKTVSAAAAAMPDLKGYGTLTDLHVAMTLDPTLIDVVTATLPNLGIPDLPALRSAVQPILDAWARAVKLPDANGVLQVRDPSTGHQDMLLLMKSDPFGHVTVVDFIYSYINGKGHLVYGFVSGAAVKDAAGNTIEEPTYQQVLSSPLPAEESWQTVKADQFGFIERYTGQPIPTFSTDTPQERQAALASLSSFVTAGWTAISLEAVRISMQSTLAQYFPGIVYDTASNSFHATTDQQLTPMYGAIFRAAPADAAGATAWLASWKPIIDVVLGDFVRGEGLTVNYAYEFTSMVRAYESIGPRRSACRQAASSKAAA